jgi:2-polyprenyl-3-methyl-5-hydroxy-6-metoxy-1,4-benzoquinol methylase
MRKIYFRDDLILNYCRGKSVLHIGASDAPYHLERARAGILLQQKLEGVCRVIGIDINRQAIDELRQLGISSIVFGDVVKDSYEINLGNYKFDYIVCADVLEHLDNPGLALDSLKTIMGPASLIVTTPNVFSLDRLVTHLNGKEINHPDHVYWPSHYTMSNIFSRKGLRVEYFTYCAWGQYVAASSFKDKLSRFLHSRMPYTLPCLFFLLRDYGQ